MTRRWTPEDGWHNVPNPASPTTGRTEQARDEAERQFPDGTWITREQDRIIFTKGWHAADANPQPTTITRAEYEEAAQRISCDIYGDVTGVKDMLSELGIEVTDDEAYRVHAGGS